MLETQGLVLEKRSMDGKLMTQSTPRPLDTFSCFISEGDNLANQHCVNNGEEMKFTHQIGQPEEQLLYIDFNVKENKTFMQEGYATFQNTNFDKLILDIVPRTTTYTMGSNTYFNLYNNFLIVPAAGDGNIVVNPENIEFVETPFNVDHPEIRVMPTFWNADYDINTQNFTNITAAPNGDGQYNIFSSEINFARITNIILLDSKQISLKTSDIAELTQGLRIRFTFKTNMPDHDWKACIILAAHRLHTCDF
jgi:hypothetical protein